MIKEAVMIGLYNYLKRIFKINLVDILFVFISFVLLQCNSNNTVQTVELIAWIPEDISDNLGNAIVKQTELFNKYQKIVKVEVKSVKLENIINLLENSINEKEAPSIIITPDLNLNNLMDNDYIIPLNKFIDTFRTVSIDDFYVPYFNNNKEIFGIPLARTLPLFIGKDFSLSSTYINWEELIKLSDENSTESKCNLYMSPLIGLFYSKIKNTNEISSDLIKTHDEIIKNCQYKKITQNELINNLNSGNIKYSLTEISTYSSYKKLIDNKITFYKVKNKNNKFVRIDYYGFIVKQISSGERNLAWAYLSWLAEPNQDMERCLNYNLIPVRKSSLSYPRLDDILKNNTLLKLINEFDEI